MSRLHALVAVSIAAATAATPSSAATVIKFDLGSSNPPADVRSDGSFFATVDDLNGATAGAQETGLVFLGPLSGQLPHVTSGASLTLQGIASDGGATLLGSTVLQATSGGELSIYDAGNTLLLSGEMGTGLISGDTTAPTGSFLSTSPIRWTGGSLAGPLEDGSLSLSFDDVTSPDGAGMAVSGDGSLASFSAIATGQVGSSGVTSVPEPSSLAGIAMALLGGMTLTRRGRRTVAVCGARTSRRIAALLVAMACLVGVSDPASAGMTLKFNFGDGGPDFGFDGSVVATPDDIDAGTAGLQNSQITFGGDFGPSFANVFSGGSLSIFGIGLNGPAATAMGGVITQPTLGGGFSIFDTSDSLVLSGTIYEGMIVGMPDVPGASFVSTSPIDYTGGWLFPKIAPPTGTFSLSLESVRSGGETGLQILGGELAPFTADATGSLGGTIRSVPEPASGVMFATMAVCLGVWGYGRRRRFLAGRG